MGDGLNEIEDEARIRRGAGWHPYIWGACGGGCCWKNEFVGLRGAPVGADATGATEYSDMRVKLNWEWGGPGGGGGGPGWKWCCCGTGGWKLFEDVKKFWLWLNSGCGMNCWEWAAL